MLRRTLLWLLPLLLATPSWATHIIGGDMYYDYLGNNQYRVTLRLYRDCGPDNVNQTGFDAFAQLGVFNSSGTLVDDASVALPDEITVPVELNDPCLTAPPSVCVSTAEYVHVFTLPPLAGGYTISYQRCCRTPAMVNLSGQQGLTCTVHIPGPPDTGNSSARFIDYPPIALCLGQNMVFDHAATDPDGDQLVYSLCSPYQGADAIDPAPAPSAPPYLPVSWAAGYSSGYPMDSSPPLSIDPATGQLTVHPTLQGTFTVGVCVEEYRNGALIGTARRDFMFRVVLCDAAVNAAIAAQTGTQACAGLTQSFSNQSTGAQTWSWDFGDTTTTADVSSAFAPQYTYPAPGTYTVTLIANPGASCADTTVADYLVAPPIQISFETALRCGPSEVTLEATGDWDPSATFAWDLGDADPPTATGTTVTALFPATGLQPVTVTASALGCTGSHTENLGIYAQPVADFAEQTVFCESLTQEFVNLSTDAAAFFWGFGDPSTTADNSSLESPAWTYGVAGYHTVRLIATNGPVCADTISRVFDVHVPPSAYFPRPPVRCPDQPALLFAQGFTAPDVQVAWDLGIGIPVTQQGVNTQALFSALGIHPVTLTLTEYGCTGSYTDSVEVQPYPVAEFENGSLACVGESFPFASLATAATPFTLSWDLGDGTTRTDSAFLHAYTEPGTYGVRLTVSTSTGCVADISAYRPDAVEVFPKPTAAFIAVPDEVSLVTPDVSITDYSALAVSWSYLVNGEEITEPSFLHTFEEPGRYLVTQTVLSGDGCSDSTTRLVTVSDHLFFAPTGFTPDDDGKNDVWRPVVVGAREYELVIFDRWGKEVFRTEDPTEGWGGDGLPQSLFVYKAHLKEWGANEKEYMGHFSLLR
ncbi:MAG: PKD domain-containing protein [Flavobacteriales bacterium]|nr:PKD domain-containing protein [Flavobacteriales bacterium]